MTSVRFSTRGCAPHHLSRARVDLLSLGVFPLIIQRALQISQTGLLSISVPLNLPLYAC